MRFGHGRKLHYSKSLSDKYILDGTKHFLQASTTISSNPEIIQSNSDANLLHVSFTRLTKQISPSTQPPQRPSHTHHPSSQLLAAPVNSAKGILPVSLAGFAVLILESLLYVAPCATLAVVASTTAAVVVVGLTAETMLAGGQLETPEPIGARLVVEYFVAGLAIGARGDG